MKQLAILCVILAVLVVGFYSFIDIIGKSMNDSTPDSSLPEVDQIMADQRSRMEQVQRDQRQMLDENRRRMEDQRRQMQDLRRRGY